MFYVRLLELVAFFRLSFCFKFIFAEIKLNKKLISVETVRY